MAARKKKVEELPTNPGQNSNGLVDPSAEEPKRDYWIEHFTWEGIKIEAKYEADWSGCNAKYGHNNAHLEIRSLEPARAPLPITQTGYLSVFHTPGMIELTAGPAAYVEEWLNREAQGAAWKKMQAPKQLDLFA